MSGFTEPEIDWSQDQMIEVKLNEPDDFLKVRETLTRIGVASRKEKKIYQSCHILHKQGRYYIVHFKELFALDGKSANLSINDVQRRNRIITLLSDWGLITIVNSEMIKDVAPLNQIKVLSFKDKGDWTLETKYNIGKKKKVVANVTKCFCKSRLTVITKINGGLYDPLFLCFMVKLVVSPKGTQTTLAYLRRTIMNNLARYHAEHLPDLMDRITKNSIGMDDYLNAFFNF